ncbi:MAG: diacylglycerol kinase family lipid kinase [Spirochaetes bacterium]|nr:diacylglycerol kinase family lipid kinase [Spirochaetota bacterium]
MVFEFLKKIFSKITFKKKKITSKDNFSKTCIIVNPKAGRHLLLNLIVNIITNKFDQNNISYKVFYTKKEGDATIISSMYNKIVDFFTVVGGDGTIREVIEGFVNNPKPIGIIPTGTANVLALELNLPFLASSAIDVIIKGNKKKIDVGFLNSKPFILMASAGIDALAVHNVNLKVKKIFGKISYIFSAIKSFLIYKPHLMNIYFEDLKIEEKGYLIIASNSKFYGGKFQIDEETKIDDGLLNIFIFKNHGFLNTIRLFLGILTKSHKSFKDCLFYKSSSLRIESQKKVFMQIDGDKAPHTPATINIKNKFVEIFVP